MALEIEDGTAKTDSTSYVTDDEFTAFATARQIDVPATVEEREKLLISAMDYLESLLYKGSRLTRAQALQWPRTGAVVYGFTVADDEIPRELKDAQLQLATDAMTVDLMVTTAPATKGAIVEETVEGAVSVKYAAPAAAGASLDVRAGGASLPRATAILAPLLRSANIAQVPVRRG